MAITSTERQEIINEVIAALKTSAKTIASLTLVAGAGASDYIELSGGRRVPYSQLISDVQNGLQSVFDNIATLIANNTVSEFRAEPIPGEKVRLRIGTKLKVLDADLEVVKENVAGLMSPNHLKALESCAKWISALRLWTGIEQNDPTLWDDTFAGSVEDSIETMHKWLQAIVVWLRVPSDNPDDWEGSINDRIKEVVQKSQRQIIRVESEEKISALIESGEIDDNTIYYVAEEE